MPLSMAARTSSQPPVWATAWPVATSTRAATTSHRPRRYTRSRESPLRRLRGTDLVPEEGGEVAAGLQQRPRRAGLRDPAVAQDDRPVGQRDGGQALRRDQHRAPGERGPAPVDELA